MYPRVALGLWIAGFLFIALGALTMYFFGVTPRKQLEKQIGCALIWPVMIFSAAGRSVLLSIIKDTQEEK
jgi:hypothetical protein